MHLSTTDRQARLEMLRTAEGFESIEKMLEAAAFDSEPPAICMNCGYTYEMEPIHGRGFANTAAPIPSSAH